MSLRIVFCLLAAATAVTVQADDFHYRNILVGEQAAGLGGAFIAVSDDPSGAYYNPAGILFSMENYFSLSANAYSYETRVYKKVLAGQDYRYTSSGLVPTFFGITQSWGKYKWGFSIVVPKSMAVDQRDHITNISQTNGQANSLKRRLFEEDRTYLIGPSVALEGFKDLTFGASIYGLYRTRNRIDNQMILFNGGGYVVEERTLRQQTFGLYPKLGAQYMPAPKISFGATLAKTLQFSSSRETQLLAVDTAAPSNPTVTPGEFKSKIPAPWELGFGAAYFPSKRLLLVSDFYYYTADKDFQDHMIEQTWNFAVGAETYLNDTTALRLGFFTNNANSPQLTSGATDQADHVDLYGLTGALALKGPGSSMTLGTTYSMGSGKGQAIGGNTTIHDIEESRLSVYLTGSYQL